MERLKSKKDIESVELHFDEKVQKYFINNKEGESSDDEGSSSLSAPSMGGSLVVKVHYGG